MSIGEVIAIIYFVIGFILTMIWWNDEYKYEYERENGFEDPIAILILIGLLIFWPLKLLKNYFESYII